MQRHDPRILALDETPPHDARSDSNSIAFARVLDEYRSRSDPQTWVYTQLERMQTLTIRQFEAQNQAGINEIVRLKMELGRTHRELTRRIWSLIALALALLVILAIVLAMRGL